MLVSDESVGLRAIIAIDSLALGPAAGGIRTRRYESDDEAIAEALKLASAMSVKCSIAGLDAGGGKIVVLEQPRMDREGAFQRLGEFIEDLDGLYLAAGDVGTSVGDLIAVARSTKHVRTDIDALAQSAGRAALRCLEACAEERGGVKIADLRVAVQGCGVMGASIARTLTKAGAEILLADTNAERAQTLAQEIGARIESPETILTADADVFAPCALGGVLSRESVGKLKAWAVCGAANNQLEAAEVGNLLMQREILYVPDFLASAGPVIAGMSASAGQADALIEGLRDRASWVLRASARAQRPTADIALEIARNRIQAAAC